MPNSEGAASKCELSREIHMGQVELLPLRAEFGHPPLSGSTGVLVGLSVVEECLGGKSPPNTFPHHLAPLPLLPRRLTQNHFSLRRRTGAPAMIVVSLNVTEQMGASLCCILPASKNSAGLRLE